MSLSLLDSPISLNSGLPEWYLQLRKTAWSEFLEIPSPNRKDENWRFANIKKLSYEGVNDAQSIDGFDIDQHLSESVHLNSDNNRILVFNNDTFLYQSPSKDDLIDKGFIFKPLSRALIDHGTLIGPYFMKEKSRLGSQKFYKLNQARQKEGYFIFIAEGLEIDEPIEVFHWLSGKD